MQTPSYDPATRVVEPKLFDVYRSVRAEQVGSVPKSHQIDILSPAQESECTERH